MKELISSIIILSLFLGIGALAQGTDLPSPGLTPDSPFYFLDTLGEKISLFFTFKAEKKAEKALKFAEEKLAEVKAMAEKKEIKALEKANQKYEKFLDLANQKTQEAKEKGKDIEELAALIIEKTLKHQEVLVEVLEKAPEEAKDAIQRAIEVSRKGSETAVEAVSKEKKEELQQKIEEVKVKVETVDWEVYRNEEYGFEVKYPKEWKIVNVDWTVGKEYVQFCSPLINNKYYFVLNLGARNKGDNTQISYQPDENWELLKSFMRLGDKVKVGNVDVLTTEIVEKGKVHSILYSDRLGAGRIEISGLEIQADLGIIEGPQHLSASDVESIDLKNLLELKLANQILSTFKFIEDETVDWEVYRNEEYGFEVKYPKEWRVMSQKYNPSSGLYYQLFLTNNEQLTLALLDSPGRKAPENELVYRLAIWEQGNIAERYQENVHYKLLGTTNNYDFVSVDDYRNPGKEIFNQILSTFKFIETDETVQISIAIDIESFDLENKTFGGWIRTGERKKVKVITTDSTEFYRTSTPEWEKEYFTFSELYSNPPRNWPVTVKGIFEEEGVIKAQEVFIISQ